jgi:hypothetical protein
MPRGTHCVEKVVFRDVQDDLGVMCAGNSLFLLTLDSVNTLNPLTQGVFQQNRPKADLAAISKRGVFFAQADG